MKLRIKQLLWVLSGIVLAVFGAQARAAEYDIDLAHAFIQFRVSHLGYSVLPGRFNKFAGTFVWEKEHPSTSKVEVTIDTASIDTNWAERDKHLRGEDYLNVKKYPKAVFKSMKYDGDAVAGKLEGNLTLYGTTRPVVLEMQIIGEGPDPWGGYRAGFKATTTLRLKDFGMDFEELGPSAETMELDLFVEGIKKGYKPLQ